jgi:hypothetical protein
MTARFQQSELLISGPCGARRTASRKSAIARRRSRRSVADGPAGKRVGAFVGCQAARFEQRRAGCDHRFRRRFAAVVLALGPGLRVVLRGLRRRDRSHPGHGERQQKSEAKGYSLVKP